MLMITVVLSSMLISYNRAGQRQITLSTEQARVVGFLTRAKAFALERNLFRGGENACGFGVHFPSQNKLVIFKTVPGVDQSCQKIYGIGVGEEIELDPRVKIKGARPDIFFEPPYLVTWLGGSKLNFISEIELTDGSMVASIQIGPGGDISAGAIQ